MEVVVYLALAVLAVPYILMSVTALKLYVSEIKNQGETALDLTKST